MKLPAEVFRYLRGPALPLASVLFSLVLVELVIRVTDIDSALVANSLYYQGAELPVHVSTVGDPLHYRLRPNSHISETVDGQLHSVHIGQEGARLPDYPVSKAAGVHRIICAGGSTMYGANVNDSETIAAQLAAKMSRPASGSESAEVVQAWNFGTSAYTLAQAATIAREQAERLNADAIVVQLYNTGRRPYLDPRAGMPVDVGQQAATEPQFWLENLPAELASPIGWTEASHQSALAHSATYRAIAATVRMRYDKSASEVGDALSRHAASELLQWARARGIQVLFVAIPATRGHLPPDAIVPGVAPSEWLDLYVANREPNFYLVHPPPRYLAEWAGTIAAYLRQNDQP